MKSKYEVRYQMKRIKKWICVMLSCAIMVVLAGQPCEISAAKDVTSVMKKDKGIQWMAENMCYYVTILHTWGDYEPDKKTTIKMNTTQKFMVAGMLSSLNYQNLDYDNDEIFDGGSWAPLNMNFVSALYKKLFGTKLARSKIKLDHLSDRHCRYKDDKYYVVYGDWGEAVPAYQIEKIVKKDKGVYQIKARNKMVCLDDPDFKINETIGTTWITVKKDKKASYGYKVTKCSYVLYEDKWKN